MLNRAIIQRDSRVDQRVPGRSCARREGISYCLLVLLLCGVVGALGASETLLTNGDFEAPGGDPLPAGWKKGQHYGHAAADSAYALDTTVVHGGAHALRLTAADDRLPVIIESQPIAVERGQRYILQVFLKGNRAGGRQFCRIYLNGDGLLLPRDLWVNDAWQSYTLIADLAHTPSLAALTVRIDLRDAGSLWVDDVTVAKADDTLPLDRFDYVGYRSRPTAGGSAVALALGEPSGQTRARINGVCSLFDPGHPLDPRFADAGLTVVRNHNVLTSLGIVTRDAQGGLTYDWSRLDRSIAAILATGAVPEMSLCFVPLALVDHPDPARIRQPHNQFYKGPPSDLNQWEEYIRAVVGHCAAGHDISHWYWIVGNEPESPKYSMGSEDEYYTLYQHTVHAAREAAPGIIIGAGSFATPNWLKHFIDRCGHDGTPVDILSWHHYASPADDYGNAIATVRSWASPYPNLRNAGLVIDEWNAHEPDGVTTRSADEYAAAQVASIIPAMSDAGLLYQTVFIAHGAGGLIDTTGVLHPLYNVMRLFAQMGTQVLALNVPADEPYVGGCARRDDAGAVTVLVWYTVYGNDPHHPSDKTISVDLGAVASGAHLSLARIDSVTSNGFHDPAHAQLEQDAALTVDNHTVTTRMRPNSVILITARRTP